MAGVFFDGRYMRVDFPDGITRFSLGLISLLGQQRDLTVLVDSAEQASLLPEHVKWHRVNPIVSPRELFLGRTLNQLGARLLFSPMQITGAIGRRFKLVLTLHDLIYYRHPEPPSHFPLWIRTVWRLFHKAYWPQRLLLDRADAIVTVSNSVARQIKRARLTNRPTFVVPNAADAPAGLQVGESRHKSRDLVYMGSFTPYKDVETLVAGMAYLPEHRLVLLSPIAESRRIQLQQLAEQLGANVLFLQGVTDEQYEEWLSRAQALVTASRDEGFGIPLVEAMAHGTPVICSDIEIFREIGGSAALRFRPGDERQFASCVIELGIAKNWLRRSSQGIEQAKAFSWEASAAALNNLISNLLSEERPHD